MYDNMYKQQELFLARDPYGIKPLYFSDSGGVFRAASQVKSLLVGGGIEDLSPCSAGHVGFFLFGSIPEPYTLYKSIQSLPAGHWIKVKKNQTFSINRYFDISETMLNASEQCNKDYNLREALLDSLSHHFVSDVPVGFFLSGGLDSSSLLGLAEEIKGPGLNTVTLGFSEFKGKKIDEVYHAEMIARNYSTKHYTEYISKVDFDDSLPDILSKMDQPTIDGVNTYFVSRAAKRQGLKVAVSGLGGDEILGGYNSFTQLPKLVGTMGYVPGNELLGKILRIFLQPILGKFFSPKWSGFMELGGTIGGAYLLRRGLYMPWELPSFLDPEMVRDGLNELRPIYALNQACLKINEPKRKVAILETLFYLRNQLLRDTDWAGMAHSLEIRLPFVDMILFESLAPVLLRKSGPSKSQLAKVVKKPLAKEIITREKVGFFVPIQKWTAGGAKKSEHGLRGWAQKVYEYSNVSLKY